MPAYREALDFYHPDDRDKVRAAVERVLKTGGEFHFKHRIINDRGETVPVESFGLARQDAHGKVGRIIGVFRALDEEVAVPIVERSRAKG